MTTAGSEPRIRFRDEAGVMWTVAVGPVTYAVDNPRVEIEFTNEHGEHRRCTVRSLERPVWVELSIDAWRSLLADAKQ